MKKLTCMTLAAAMTLSLLSGCGGGSAATPAPQDSTAPVESEAPVEKSFDEMTIDELKPLLQTVTDGKLTVATSPDFAPYEFYAIAEDGTPTIAGFDMALAQYMADYLGLELEILPMDFDGVLMELQPADPKRANIMDFSHLYYMGGQSFICLESNKDKFPDLASTNDPSLQIGAQTGSIQVDLAEANSPDAEIIRLAKVPDIIAEVLAGQMDGAYMETVVAEGYKVKYPELCVVLEVPYEASEGSAVGVAKDNPALLAAINLAVDAALDDGSMAQFIAEANELANGGEVYEGLLDESGNVQG